MHEAVTQILTPKRFGQALKIGPPHVVGHELARLLDLAQLGVGESEHWVTIRTVGPDGRVRRPTTPPRAHWRAPIAGSDCSEARA